MAGRGVPLLHAAQQKRRNCKHRLHVTSKWVGGASFMSYIALTKFLPLALQPAPMIPAVCAVFYAYIFSAEMGSLKA